MNNGARTEADCRRSTSSADGLSRRDFIALAGLTTATLALTNDAFGETPKAGEKREAALFDEAKLAPTHDLVSLPDWGPYSKKFFGISHIPDVTRGLSFDFSLFISPVQGTAMLPSVTDHSGVHPWEASSDLEFYSLRLETIWKDQLYCDLAFCRLDSQSRLIRLEVANETSAPQEVALNCLAQLCFPPFRELTAQPVRLCNPDLPSGAVWVHALDYVDLIYAKPRPTDNLVPDGKFRGEARLQDSVEGSAVAEYFGRDAGDTLDYRVHLDHRFTDAVLIWRFRLDRGESVSFQMEGAAQQKIHFQGIGDFTTVPVPLGDLRPGAHHLRFISNGGASSLAMNGFVIAEAEQAKSIRFSEKSWSPVPKVETTGSSGILVKYRDVPNWYGISLEMPLALEHQLRWRDLDATFHNQSSADTKQRIFGDGPGRPGDPDSLFLHAASKPFTIPSHAKRTIYGIICTGTEAAVRQSLKSFDPRSPRNKHIFSSARNKAFQVLSSPGGEPYRFSQQRMAAVTLTNLVYPLYTQREAIRHFSPGKIWDCLYTWDSGFIGLGLLEIDARRALEDLNAYTTPEGAQSAFIHHGTPLPTQIYLYRELWNRTQSREMLAYFYPRLRQYHRFLAGRLGSSTTRRHQDHLIVTWDYFYNSGGWDDYPPQV
ncbi:MAG: twin-arginine translocation signal domain-containing protein, partial [Terriglobia bacterium]